MQGGTSGHPGRLLLADRLGLRLMFENAGSLGARTGRGARAGEGAEGQRYAEDAHRTRRTRERVRRAGESRLARGSSARSTRSIRSSVRGSQGADAGHCAHHDPGVLRRILEHLGRSRARGERARPTEGPARVAGQRRHSPHVPSGPQHRVARREVQGLPRLPLAVYSCVASGAIGAVLT